MPRTKSKILEFIFTNWITLDEEGRAHYSGEKAGFENSVNRIDEVMDEDGDPIFESPSEEGLYLPSQSIYMPHPLDGLFVIDSSSSIRKLDLLESRI